MPGDMIKVKAGVAILAVAWVALVAWSIVSLVLSKRRAGQATSACRAGGQVRRYPRCGSHIFANVLTNQLQLLTAVMAALIFIGIRVLYTLVAFVTQDKTLSPVTGSLAIRVILSLFTELIATLIFIAGGFVTMNARRDSKRQHHIEPGRTAAKISS